MWRNLFQIRTGILKVYQIIGPNISNPWIWAPTEVQSRILGIRANLVLKMNSIQKAPPRNKGRYTDLCDQAALRQRGCSILQLHQKSSWNCHQRLEKIENSRNSFTAKCQPRSICLNRFAYINCLSLNSSPCLLWSKTWTHLVTMYLSTRIMRTLYDETVSLVTITCIEFLYG